MKKTFLKLVIFMTGLSLFAQKDEFVGFYVGKSGDKEIAGEVFRYYDDTYRLRLYTDIIEKQGDILFEASGLVAKDSSIEIKDNATFLSIMPEEINGKFDAVTTHLVRFDYESETMGLKAPKDAIVLFGGKDLSTHWVMGKKEPTWIIKDDVALLNSSESSSIETKEAFGAMRFHLEFKTPAVYNEEKQQKRGNSGIKFGPYEIQILDSFGTLDFNYYDVGSIYSLTKPLVNASLEPDAWQSFDIEFIPVKYDNNGNILSLPRFTVFLNGILVQDNVEVNSPTNAKEKKNKDFKHPPQVKIQLQDHQHDVSFRNIWLLPYNK